MLCSETIGSYTAYGVKNTATNAVINDISSSIEYVSEIVKKLNKYQASPIHLYEIIDNFISD